MVRCLTEQALRGVAVSSTLNARRYIPWSHFPEPSAGTTLAPVASDRRTPKAQEIPWYGRSQETDLVSTTGRISTKSNPTYILPVAQERTSQWTQRLTNSLIFFGELPET